MDIDEAIIVNVVAVPAFPQKQAQQLVRVPLQKSESKIHMIVTFNEDSDEEEVPEKSEEAVGDSPQCVICEFVMTKLEAELKDKKTEVRSFELIFFYFYIKNKDRPLITY